VTERLDYSFDVLQTMLRVVYADITRLEVDAVVSTDDVHFSRVEPNGVATAIRAAAGDVPHDDARKHSLPVPLGSVIVTGAGRLSAKYIFHTTTFEFNSRPNPHALIPQVVQRVLEIASVLRIERLAMPVLVSGRAGMPKPEVIIRMLRSASCYLLVWPHALRELTIAVYTGGTADHVRAEQARIEEIKPVRDQISRWAAEMAALNSRLALVQPLLALTGDDGELRRLLEARHAADCQALCRLFECPESSDAAADHDTPAQDGAPRSGQEYDFARRQLEALLQDLTEEAEHLGELQRTEKRRLHSLERQRAQRGSDTSPEIVTEIEDIRRNLDQRSRQVQQLEEQRRAAQHDLETLQQRWQQRRAPGPP
jgi:O-acetyl-ADP-ribose deacetylase (regulator of RNase III)